MPNSTPTSREQKMIEQWASRSIPGVLKQDKHISVLLKLLSITATHSREQDSKLFDIISPASIPKEHLKDLSKLLGYNMDSRVDPDYQRMYIQRYLDTRRKRGSLQSIRNVAASFAQTDQSYLSASVLNDIEIIEYGINDEGFSSGGDVWAPGTMFVKLRQGSRIMIDKINEIIPGGTRIILGTLDEMVVPDYDGPYVTTLYEILTNLFAYAVPPTFNNPVLHQLYPYTIDQIHEMYKFILMTRYETHRHTNVVDSVNTIGYNELSTLHYKLVTNFSPQIITEQSILTELELNVIRVFGFNLEDRALQLKTLEPYTIDYLEDFREFVKTEYVKYLDATSWLNLSPILKNTGMFNITDLGLKEEIKVIPSTDAYKVIELPKIITSLNTYSHRLDELYPYTIDTLESLKPYRKSFYFNSIERKIKAEPKVSQDITGVRTSKVKAISKATSEISKLQEISVTHRNVPFSNIDRIQDIQGFTLDKIDQAREIGTELTKSGLRVHSWIHIGKVVAEYFYDQGYSETTLVRQVNCKANVLQDNYKNTTLEMNLVRLFGLDGDKGDFTLRELYNYSIDKLEFEKQPLLLTDMLRVVAIKLDALSKADSELQITLELEIVKNSEMGTDGADLFSSLETNQVMSGVDLKVQSLDNLAPFRLDQMDSMKQNTLQLREIQTELLLSSPSTVSDERINYSELNPELRMVSNLETMCLDEISVVGLNLLSDKVVRLSELYNKKVSSFKEPKSNMESEITYSYRN